MLEKEAIQKAFHSPKEFIRNLILVDKTDGERLLINLKNLNVFIPYQQFKMKDLLHLIIDILQEGNLM